MIENVDQLMLLIEEDFNIKVQIVFEPIISNHKSDPEYTLNSSEIEDLGIFKHALESCRFDSFGRIRKKDDKYLVNLYLRYEHKDGGGNGCSLFKSYIFNTQTKNWYRVNKELDSFSNKFMVIK